MKALRNLHPAWIATAIGAIVVLWILSGMLGGAPEFEQANGGSEPAGEVEPVKVQVQKSRAEPIVREAELSGRTAPVRSVTVRAQTSGRVSQVVAERGAMIERNAIIVRLSVDDRRAQKRQAEAVLTQRQLQYKAAKKLQAKGYQTELDLAQARANLQAAEAEVERLGEDLAHTVLRAPFAGVLETRPVEEGDFVSIGDEIGRIIDQDPFIVRANVSEDVIGFLETGQPGTAVLIDKRVKQGKLRYIATDADEQTRTYRVELEVPNPDGKLISGASTTLRLPLEQVMAHEVEPAILTLNDQGDFGIKSVDDNNRVAFHKAEIVRNRDGKVWLSGLPETLQIITVGQGFVTAGDQARTTTEDIQLGESAGAKQGAGETIPVPEGGQ